LEFQCFFGGYAHPFDFLHILPKNTPFFPLNMPKNRLLLPLSATGQNPAKKEHSHKRPNIVIVSQTIVRVNWILDDFRFFSLLHDFE